MNGVLLGLTAAVSVPCGILKKKKKKGEVWIVCVVSVDVISLCANI